MRADPTMSQRCTPSLFPHHCIPYPGRSAASSYFPSFRPIASYSIATNSTYNSLSLHLYFNTMARPHKNRQFGPKSVQVCLLGYIYELCKIFQLYRILVQPQRNKSVFQRIQLFSPILVRTFSLRKIQIMKLECEIRSMV